MPLTSVQLTPSVSSSSDASSPTSSQVSSPDDSDTSSSSTDDGDTSDTASESDEDSSSADDEDASDTASESDSDASDTSSADDEDSSDTSSADDGGASDTASSTHNDVLSDDNDSIASTIPCSGRKKIPHTTNRKTKEDLVRDIIDRQIPDVKNGRKLSPKDIHRICNNIDRSILCSDSCCLWKGHVTNMNNLNKGRYVNFYFKRKKVALHRLLYVNFVGKLNTGEYLKFSCDNKGICCNVNHLKKFKYQNMFDDSVDLRARDDSAKHRSHSGHAASSHRSGRFQRLSSSSVQPASQYQQHSRSKSVPITVIHAKAETDKDYHTYRKMLTLRLDSDSSTSDGDNGLQTARSSATSICNNSNDDD